MKIFGREPALWLAFTYSVISMLGAFVVNFSTTQEGTLNAVLAAVFGLIVAFQVHDGLSAAILGLVKALVAVGVAFGLHLDPDHQALVMTFAASVVAMFVRTQVTAAVPAELLARPSGPRPNP